MEMRTCAELYDSSYQSAQSQKMKRKAGGFIAFSSTACFIPALWAAFSLADAVLHWQDRGDFPSVLFHSFSWHLSLSVLLQFHLFRENDPWMKVRTGLFDDDVPFFFLFLKARRPSILIIVVWQQFHSKCWKVCWGDSSYWLKL